MPLTDPMISVIIPTYNRAHIISRSIKSVLCQTYQDFELIIMDDGSTDNTEEIVKYFDDSRIRYIRRKINSGGPVIPTNEGIEAARGEYIAIQDSDDEWLQEKLEKQIKVFEDTTPNVGIVYTDMWRVSEDGKKKKYWRSHRIMPEDGIIYKQALGYRVAGIGTQTLMIRKACFKKAGLFDERLRMLIDTELLIRMSKYYHFYHIGEPLVNYFMTSKSLVYDNNSLVAARKMILETYFEDIKGNNKLLAKHYRGIGFDLCRSGLFQRQHRFARQGIGYLVKAAMIYPLSINL